MEKGYDEEEEEKGPMPSSPRATRCVLSRDFM